MTYMQTEISLWAAAVICCFAIAVTTFLAMTINYSEDGQEGRGTIIQGVASLILGCILLGLWGWAV